MDYVQFDRWKITACFSDDEHFKVSASYAMGIMFTRLKGGYKTGDGKNPKLVDIASSFFVSSDKARLGCYSYGHGIVYEGCWVSYDGKTMRGSSKRDLPTGKCFSNLCEEKTFQRWFTKVLNGTYKGCDFDTMPLDTLISLTSPNSPGSLASEKPAGMGPCVGLAAPNNQIAARTAETRSMTAAIFKQAVTPAQQGAGKIMLRFTPIGNDQVAAAAQKGAVDSPSMASTNPPTALAITEAVKEKEARLSIGDNDQVLTNQDVASTKPGSSPDLPLNQSAEIAKEENATAVQNDSESASRATMEPLAATPPPSNATGSMKRQNASPLTSSLDKRTKIDPAHQQLDIINISSDEDEDVTTIQRKPQSAGFAAKKPSAGTPSPSNVTSKYMRDDADTMKQYHKLVE